MIFRSPYPDVAIPEVSLSEYVLGGAAARGEKPALIDGPSGRALTYGGLVGAARRAAGGLAARGFGKGDVFAILSPNLPEYAVAFHAVAMLGGVNTTLNPLYTVEEIAYQLNDSGARSLMTVPALLDKATAAADQAGVREVFVFGAAEGATPFAALLAHDGPAPEVAIDPREDLVALPYSSGTTGLPKGVMLTHRNLVANLAQTGATERCGPDDTLIGILPFYHIYGMVVVMNMALARGATVVTMPRFEMEGFLQLLQDHRVTRAYLAPPLVLALARSPLVERYDLSALRMIVSGAAPLDERLARSCGERLGCAIKQAYGMTEASPVTHLNPEPPATIKLGAIGLPTANTECQVVDLDTGRPLGPNERGELWVRGPQVMRGYLNRPDATAQTVDAAGWLHTGDVVVVDDEGYFTVVDRVKELIKYKGFQVPPAELEALLLTHPAIADAAVVPLPDEEAGQVPKAFVVATDAALTAEAVRDFVAARVAPHKRLREVEFIEGIPKSPSGKILRRLLIARDQPPAG